MGELREMSRRAWAYAKDSGYLRWCDDCEGAQILDRYALTQVLEEEFSDYPDLAEKWEEIEYEFVKIEALLHASGLVNVHGHVVEPAEGPPEDRADYELVCQDCYRERDL